METFNVYVKQGTGAADRIGVADLIPEGRENAISREMLLEKCKAYGLCSSDRAMRKMIESEKTDYVILAREEGGYYRPTHEDMLDLNRYIRQEKHRAMSILKNLKKALCLYEDYKRGIM